MAPLTSAEKQKRYKERLKQDPEKYEEYKRKRRENYHAKKRLIKDLKPKEKENARVIWKLRKQRQRQQKKNLVGVIAMTPPSSPSLIQGIIPQLGNDYDTDFSDQDIPSPHSRVNSPRQEVNSSPGRKKMRKVRLQVDSPNQSQKAKKLRSHQHRVGSPPISHTPKKKTVRKRLGRYKTALHQENLRLKSENEILKKKYQKYKKRYLRNENLKQEETEELLGEKVKYAKLSNAIRDRYNALHKKQEKNVFKNIFQNIEGAGKEVIIREALGLKGKLRSKVPVKDKISPLRKKIADFFLRDDVTRATAGKKETVTKSKTKVQKRVLLDTMKNLYKTFKEENAGVTCSYFYFTKNKPFFVVKPSVDGREMCLCKTHINPTYKAQVLKKKQVIKTDDLNELIKSTVCDPNNEACMYALCQDCRDKIVMHDVNKNEENIKWFEWSRQQEFYEKDGKKMKAVKNVKIEKEAKVEDLMKFFNEEFKIFKKHVYVMKLQFKNFREAVDKLEKTEVVIVADFSENYSCKHHEEVQAHHFGGSRQQVSLHTVVVYVPDDGDKKHKVESYCTVSSSTNHQPPAIWAHLDPILKDIRNKHPDVKTVHFYTDGPFSQYRQKQNFYLSSTKIFDYGFTAMTWSFFEAGHGKGPADGIGGFMKRTADNMVALGTDIVCADQFYEILKDRSKITLYLISPEDIEVIKDELPTRISPLFGTLNVHQVFTSVRGVLKYRNIGCFCTRGFCECRQPKTYLPFAFLSTDKNIKAKVDSLTAEDSNNIALSDDENVPLSSLKTSEKSPLKEISVVDLCEPRKKTWYDIVYNSPNSSDSEQSKSHSKKTEKVVTRKHCPDESQPSTSSKNMNDDDKENRAVRKGDYLIVYVHATKGAMYKYACIVDQLDDDGEIQVTFLRCVKSRKVFRLDKNDVSCVDPKDIVQILPKPDVKTKRGQRYYEFKNPIDIIEM